MTTHEVILELKGYPNMERNLVLKGLLSSTVLRQYEVYNHLQALTVGGLERMQAVRECMKLFQCSEKTVYNAVNSMEL